MAEGGRMDTYLIGGLVAAVLFLMNELRQTSLLMRRAVDEAKQSNELAAKSINQRDTWKARAISYAPEDWGYEHCPSCRGDGGTSDGVMCQRCDGMGYVDVEVTHG